MKKILITGLLAAFTSLSAQADTVFGIYAGASLWQTDADGRIEAPDLGGYDIEMDKSTLTDENNSFYYIALEHPVPVLPNIRLVQTDILHEGEGSFTYFSSTSQIKGEIDLSHTDLTFYYEVLDNYLSLDLGLTARMFDGHLGVDFSTTESPIDTTLAMLYARAQVELPLTGMGVGLDINAGDNGDEKGTDINGFLQYETPIGIGFAAGYRALKADIETRAKAGSIKVDATVEFDIDGPYLSIFYHL